MHDPALTPTWTCFIDHRCNMHESLARGPRNTFSSSGFSGSSALGLRLELVRSLQRLWRLVGLALRVEVVRLRPLQRLWRMALQRLWRMVGLALPPAALAHDGERLLLRLARVHIRKMPGTRLANLRGRPSGSNAKELPSFRTLSRWLWGNVQSCLLRFAAMGAHRSESIWRPIANACKP